MSKITNIILTCSLGEKEEYVLSKLNEFKYEGKQFNIVSINDDKLMKNWYGGSKKIESCIFIGAYNYLNLKEFMLFLKSIEWEDFEDVQVIVKEEDDEKFRIINLLDNE